MVGLPRLIAVRNFISQARKHKDNPVSSVLQNVTKVSNEPLKCEIFVSPASGNYTAKQSINPGATKDKGTGSLD